MRPVLQETNRDLVFVELIGLQNWLVLKPNGIGFPRGVTNTVAKERSTAKYPRVGGVTRS